ncbi:DsbA family oxidoreductase [Melittangium boletus]|uniref:DsbA family oxidoreductase n=1 Tax=Melittangium boletus TaxID=83453 RepID=UPI003DA5B230
MKPVKIDIFSDVVCPWCLIGTERLNKVLVSQGLRETAQVRYHAFMLRPDAPEGGTNLREELRAKYGADPQAMFARVEAAARESGLALDLSRQTMSYPTVRAHTLLRHAHAKGTQEALARALFEAHFHDALDISSPEVLQRLARAHGFTDEETLRILQDAEELATTRADADEARQQGIQGVPFFIFNDRLALSGAQPENVFREALRQALQE